MCACVFVCVLMSACARTCAFAHVTLLIQHATRMRHIVYGFSGFAICYDIIS